MTELKFRNKGSIIFLKGNIKEEEVKLQTRHMYKNGMAPAKIKKMKENMKEFLVALTLLKDHEHESMESVCV